MAKSTQPVGTHPTREIVGSGASNTCPELELDSNKIKLLKFPNSLSLSLSLSLYIYIYIYYITNFLQTLNLINLKFTILSHRPLIFHSHQPTITLTLSVRC